MRDDAPRRGRVRNALTVSSRTPEKGGRNGRADTPPGKVSAWDARQTSLKNEGVKWIEFPEEGGARGTRS